MNFITTLRSLLPLLAASLVMAGCSTTSRLANDE